jgi:hypothetical protein
MIEFHATGRLLPVHSHHRMRRSAMRRDMTFVTGDDGSPETGASWIVRRGSTHSVESETARLVAAYALAGMDHGFRNAGLPAAAPTLPPAEAPTRPLEEIEEAFNHAQMTTFGPQMGPDD